MQDVSSQKHPKKKSFEEFIRDLLTKTRNPQAQSDHYERVNRIDDHLEIFKEARESLTSQADKKELSSSGVEWFLDNYFVLLEAGELIQDDLPETYFRKLPGLSAEDGLPRIYFLAHQILGHYELELVRNTLDRTLAAYQKDIHLEMSELWALPLMLRLALLETISGTIPALAQELPEVAGFDPPGYPDLDPDEAIARALRTLILLDRIEWKDLFETHSRVDKILRKDPAKIYARMDFETRDRYRKRIEFLAEKSNVSEIKVAETAIALAKADSSERPKTNHVGYYLIDDGEDLLREKIGFSATWKDRGKRFFFDHATVFYVGSIAGGTLLGSLGLMLVARTLTTQLWQLAILWLLSLIPSSSLAINLINSILTTSLPPRILPKMDFSKKIPRKFRSVVTIPAMLTQEDEINFLLRQMELHYLANNDPNIGFVLLSDFADADEKTMPEDDSLRLMAIQGIERLNRRYQGEKGVRPFLLFHRLRQWNPQEGVWMGWERKRGKLTDFNRYLLEGFTDSWDEIVGDTDFLQRVRFVITADADTILPRDSATSLIATLAHPLNQAEFAEGASTVTSGYTILQPRTEVKPTSVNQSLFTRVFAGDLGLDLYTRAVSNVYQDLFGEGIYVGKGIYDVAAFERSLEDKVPQNAILSHDLFEGIQGRAGLVSDIVFFEDYPPDYNSQVERLHRWVRGDWQLLPWLFPRVPRRGGGSLKNTFPLRDLWKIIDDLRRSLESPAFLLALLAGWLMIPQNAWLWTLALLFVSAFTMLKSIITAVSSQFLRGAATNLFAHIRTSFYRWLFWVIFLPYESVIMIDAIATTLVRVFISHKRLLQWRTSAHTVRLFGQDRKISAIWLRMIAAPLTSLFWGGLVYLVNPGAFWSSVPLFVLWIFSPQIAYWISQVRDDAQKITLSQKDQQRLRRVARQTWLYFERFISPEDHWLPPDHFQEDPKGQVAHRTSPTNIGLLLLSNAAAHDLGYIGITEFIYRTAYTMETLDGLEKYRGHLLNWYDTQTLATLSPRYVSTVDSGNYAASLVGLRQSLRALSEQPILSQALYAGIIDTLDVFCHLMENIQPHSFHEEADKLHAHCQEFQNYIRRKSLGDTHKLSALTNYAERLTQPMQPLITSMLHSERMIDPDTLQDLRFWSDAIFQQFANTQRQIQLLAPWIHTWQQRPADLDAIETEQFRKALTLLREDRALELALGDLPQWCETIQSALASLSTSQYVRQLPGWQAWVDQFQSDLTESRAQARQLIDEIEGLTERITFHLERMEFGFLFDHQQEVFYLGYQVGSGRLDQNHYDLLASEARTASLYAIAVNHIPRSHWLHLNRPFTSVRGTPTLLSWNGSMFEYLMPNLFTHTYPETLLHLTADGVVRAQIDYAKENSVPWGISESAFYHFDTADNYQYRGFGVPGLGRKRGLADDLVIAPYASLMAVAVDPQAVLKNITALIKAGALGHFGFYEAIDYTPARLPVGQEKALVKTYMAHHQGMILVALGNYLNAPSLIDRIHQDPHIESVELLLQEQIPQTTPAQATRPAEVTAHRGKDSGAQAIAWPVPPNAAIPSAQALSNGRLRLVMTDTGGGYLAWNDLALTRWRQDATLDPWGIWFYLQDLDKGRTWSLGQQPIQRSSEEYRVFFAPHMIEIRRVEQGLRTNLRTTLSPTDDILVQKITLTNQTNRPRRIRLVSYGEVVLAPQATDQRHPAFNKMFIQSSYHPELRMLHFKRRKRSSEEADLGMAHMVYDDRSGTVEYESDRGKFIGRGHDISQPIALMAEQPLSGTTGNTLDPIFALGRRFTLRPNETIEVVYLTLVAEDPSRAAAWVAQYQDLMMIENVFGEAQSHSEKWMRALKLDSHQIADFAQLMSHIVYPVPTLRPEPSLLASNTRGQSGLWSFGISGDYPLLLVTIDRKDALPTIQEALIAHRYWRKMGLTIDLVILNTWDSGYAHELNERVHATINALDSGNWVNRRGGIFVLTASQMEPESITLLKTAARVTLDAQAGDLAAHLRQAQQVDPALPPLIATGAPQQFVTDEQLERPQDLLFDNGLGGFTADGREYQLYLENYPKLTEESGQITPAPWINVVANEEFGFLVTESGGGYTWAVNSGENRLTPWTNDPVSDPSGESLYLRDEITGEVWSPTPAPAGGGRDYLVRHGQGYTVFESINNGIRQEMKVFTPPDAPVKVIDLTLTNLTQAHRRLTATYYAEWVLGVDRENTQAFIVPDYDHPTGSLLARNTYSAEFSQRVAFLTSDHPVHGLTTDRREFLGEPGNRQKPQALTRVGLSDKARAGVDPCAALQTHLNFKPGEAQRVRFVIGQGADRAESLALARRFSQPDALESAFEAAVSRWDGLLETLQVETPATEMNLILNRWLQYQALSCRIWGRSGFYQSSGAYGFRDQLQDVTAILANQPKLARAHILRAARHQFDAGDVLHWWHPPSGRGVRTRITDDLLWPVYVTAEYVRQTGDSSILHEQVPFRLGDPLAEDEEERYGHYPLSEETGTLFEHCRRALEQGDTSGPHGLPLIGGGDWNDGMNRVGIEGKGESVWLGWFLVENHRRFADLCRLVAEVNLAEAHLARAEALATLINQVAWDDDWYLRAYYDDGTPLGSPLSEECQIDSLPQSWSVLTGAGTPDRQKKAMDSLLGHLVQEDGRLIRLFTPPFDKTEKDPGYIKGYPPGIRENGGQYTHAAIWAVWALTELGQGDRAFDLFRYLNPITHSVDLASANRYAVEPYVVAADVYSTAPYVGHGGWTWYTGSSGWLYRLGMEAILGFRLQGDHFSVDPCIPTDWDGFQMTYQHDGSAYHIRVENPDHVQKGVRKVTLDGKTLPEGRIPLQKETGERTVTVILGDD